ncbi:FapA family protein [Megalodesulfovibrio paquesii]
MPHQCITIATDNEAEAMEKACLAFDAPKQHIQLTLKAPGSYEACQVHGDASIDIALSEDQMEAVVAGYSPAFGNGAAISAGTFVKALTKAGVRVPPVPTTLQLCLEQAQAGKDIRGTVLVRGRQPEDARDATVVPIGDWNYPVLPHVEFGTVTAKAAAKAGMTVTGTPIPAAVEGPGKSIEFPPDSNCRLDQRTLTVRSETYGLIDLQGTSLQVKPWVTVSDDAMQVTGVVHHRDSTGNVLTRERMQEVLGTLGITARIDAITYEAAWAKARETNHPTKNVPLCKGKLPVHGQDGFFEFLAQDERSVVGVQDKTGRIDFRARGTIRAVEQGSILGVLHPPVPGVAGQDVRGRALPSKDGAPCQIVAKENVKIQPDGATYVATEKGVVVYARNTIAVTDVYVIEGDLNISVGNITLEKGSVHVRGAVWSGFSVEVPGNILVDQVVESARLVAGGSVSVRGGVMMETSGFIKAGGDVAAVFAMNATIEAGGDVLIKHELTNCNVSTDGRVLATEGRGKIVGGVIQAAQGVAAQEVGSDLGVETIIHLGRESQRDQQRTARKHELECIIDKISASLGKDSDAAILKRTPPDKQPTIARLLQTRKNAALELAEIDRAILEEREARRAAYLATRLKVNKTLWPGVIIHAGGVTHRVAHAVQHCQVYFDPSEKQLLMLSL